MSGVYSISDWDLKNIKITDDWGRPIRDEDEPTGYDFVPEEFHEEMNLLQCAKYYNVTPTYLNEEISYDFFLRMSAYIKAFNWSYPSKKGQIPPNM